MIRTVSSEEITRNIKEMCIEANHVLSEDMKTVFYEAVESEKSDLGRQVLCQLKENLRIAGEDMIPICQDTGMAVIFIKVGQDVHIEGKNLTDAIKKIDSRAHQTNQYKRQYPRSHSLRNRKR